MKISFLGKIIFSFAFVGFLISGGLAFANSSTEEVNQSQARTILEKTLDMKELRAFLHPDVKGPRSGAAIPAFLFQLHRTIQQSANPVQVVVSGKVLTIEPQIVGEGRRSYVYKIKDHDLVIKIPKYDWISILRMRSEHSLVPRESIANFRVAKTEYQSPSGFFAVKEYVPGPLLVEVIAQDPTLSGNPKLKATLIELFEKRKNNIEIMPDPNPTNFVVQGHSLVAVDMGYPNARKIQEFADLHTPEKVLFELGRWPKVSHAPVAVTEGASLKRHFFELLQLTAAGRELITLSERSQRFEIFYGMPMAEKLLQQLKVDYLYRALPADPDTLEQKYQITLSLHNKIHPTVQLAKALTELLYESALQGKKGVVRRNVMTRYFAEQVQNELSTLGISLNSAPDKPLNSDELIAAEKFAEGMARAIRDRHLRNDVLVPTKYRNFSINEQKVNNLSLVRAYTSPKKTDLPLYYQPQQSNVFEVPYIPLPLHEVIELGENHEMPILKSDNHFRFFIHPISTEFFAPLIKKYGLVYDGFMATPTSSTRSVLMWDMRAAEQVYFAKLSLAIPQAGRGREVRPGEALHAVMASEFAADFERVNALPMKAWLEPYAMIPKGAAGGLIVRKMEQDTHLMRPLFAAFSRTKDFKVSFLEGLAEANKITLYEQSKIFLQELLSSLEKYYLATGLIPEPHSQNVSFRYDGKRFIFAFKDASGVAVNFNHRRMLGLPVDILEKYKSSPYYDENYQVHRGGTYYEKALSLHFLQGTVDALDYSYGFGGRLTQEMDVASHRAILNIQNAQKEVTYLQIRCDSIFR